MITSEKTFSIKETVNKNIERVQFPSFNNHRSLIGWCNMNYPKVLQNPQFMAKPKPKPPLEDLDHLYQIRNKERQNAHLVKPFTNYIVNQNALKQDKKIEHPQEYKKTLLTLTTTKREIKTQILEESLKGYEKYLNIRPLSCQLPQQPNDNFSRKIRQIGEVYYTPSYESEDIRHLKKLPNSIITEQNLIELLSPELKFLNMHNHTWISRDQINKIGYFAPNIEELILSSTLLEDDILIELAKSCKLQLFYLKKIDISQCEKLTEKGIRKFLELKKGIIESFKCAHNIQSVTDYAIEPLREAKNLKCISVSFCTNLSNNFLQFLANSQCQLNEIYFSSNKIYIFSLIQSALESLTAEALVQVINASKNHLEVIDLSFITTKEIGEAVGMAIGNCQNLVQLILTGCNFFNDHSMYRMASGQNFKQLQMLKLGGLANVSDNGLNSVLQHCHKLKFLEVNNLERLSDNSLNIITKNCPQLQIVNMNFTPNISEQNLQEKKSQFPAINFIRNIIQHTDSRDDGLRMPLPLKSVVMQVTKKKKKKK